MDRSNTQVRRVVRWRGWAVVCAMVVSLGAWAPDALAEDAMKVEADRPAEPTLEELANPNWSLAIDPSFEKRRLMSKRLQPFP